jgi:hypothetical protein
MGNNVFGNKVRVISYIDPKIYAEIEKERLTTKESQSGMIASILESYVIGCREVSENIDAETV